MAIAKVIVDVPTMQTNQSYDYKIPKVLMPYLATGFRVEVPFGARHVQGFIVDIVANPTFEGELKPITRLIDSAPVLNQELLDLGQTMAKQLFAFQIHCYQSMLPTALRAAYDKEVQPTDAMPAEVRKQVFRDTNSLQWSSLKTPEAVRDMLQYVKQQWVTVKPLVKNKAKIKTVQQITWLVQPEAAHQLQESLSKAARQLRALLDYRVKHATQTTVLRKELEEAIGISLVTLKKAQEKDWISLADIPVYRDPYRNHQFKPSQALALTEAQQHVFDVVANAIKQQQAQTFLLQGVTGSGKTEVYLQLIARALKMKRGAVMLVPEISLTPQMVKAFKRRFGDRVAVLHSALSEGEKYDEWRRVEQGLADIVVGARSSIFAPLKNIGIIIIDEEHESSYKQEEAPSYHARQIAQLRAQYHHCPVVLGSATPSLESRARAHKHVYHLLEMPERVNQQALPHVEIVDMREERREANFSMFSEVLQQKIADRLARQEQVVLLLNRRGYSSFLMCRECGHVVQCPNCDISLTYHIDAHRLKCHYCGHSQRAPQHCPSCQSEAVRYYGVGTQKIEEELVYLFPEARVIRMDVDTTQRKGQHERLLEQFGRHEADILLGTQMIAKGLDFPNVTLVGVINADTALHLPDFRSFEKTFQLLTQVAGRSGRGSKSGEVVIQTYNPEHYAIQYAKDHNYDQFYRHEMHLRHLGNYPPYFYTALISISHHDEAVAERFALSIAQMLKQKIKNNLIILGPSAKNIARINKQYHFQILLKYKNQNDVQEALEEVLQLSQTYGSQRLRVSIDIEPNQFI